MNRQTLLWLTVLFLFLSSALVVFLSYGQLAYVDAEVFDLGGKKAQRGLFGGDEVLYVDARMLRWDWLPGQRILIPKCKECRKGDHKNCVGSEGRCRPKGHTGRDWLPYRCKCAHGS